MGMPVLGPPTATPFSPLAPTLLEPRPPEPYQPGVSLRPPGSAYGLEAMRRSAETPYTPPVWEREIRVVDPLLVQAGSGSVGSPNASAFQRPGLPERVNINPFGDDPLGSFLGGGAGVALGILPGQGQRGGAYHGIATTPLTLANMSTWGREGVLAALTSWAGLDYQQPENAQFGMQPEQHDDTILGAAVKGLADFGNVVWSVIDAPIKWYRDSNAFNRGKDVRNLFLTGKANPYLVEEITTSIFGGRERFSMDALQQAALREGVSLMDAIAKRFDLSDAQVAAIAANPYMSDEELGAITDGSALSVDPVSNLLLEGGLQVAMLAAGGIGVAKGAALLGRSGVGALEALGAGLRGGGAAGLAGKAGYLTRRALQINAWNTTAGWTIRGAEWGIKQAALIAGNDELVRMMDRLMWQMPLSMNPGWNLIDGFSSHPIDAYRNLRGGQVAVGRRGTPGYVGQLDLKGLALRDGTTGETMTVSIAGRQVRLGRNTEEFKVLGRLRDLTPDDMHAQFFDRLGWDRGAMERVFGEGNPYDLTWDDARNALFHVALEAVREGKGPIGRLEGMDLPTMPDRTAAFVRDNAKGALKVLDDNLTGRSSSMVDLFKGDFWNLAARNDTRMGVIKAPLGPWDKDMAFLDFASWVRASKVVRAAIEAGTTTKDATPTFRRTVNRAFVAEWVKRLGEQYQPDQVVPLSFINQLKRFGGAVESRGKGAQLVRGRQAAYTRKQLEEIVDSIIAEDDIAMRNRNAVPRDQAAAYRKGIDPGQDPLEDARVLGISATALEIIDAARAKPPEQLVSMPPPSLLRHVAEMLGMSVDKLQAMKPEDAWSTVFGWYDDLVEQATATAALRDNLDEMAKALRARAGDGRMDPADATTMVAALERIRNEALNPLDPKVAQGRPGLYQAWEATTQEGLVLAQAIEKHLADDARFWRTVEVSPGVQAALPSSLNGKLLERYQALIAKVLKDGSPFLSEFDRARLEDPAIHPFLKSDILKAAASPSDRVVLRDLEAAIGGDPREIVTRMLNDGGIDPTDPAAGAATAAQRTAAYIEEGRTLGAQAAQLARRFQTLGGAYSDELADTLDRVRDYDAAVRAMKPEKGRPKPKNVGSMSMDPEDGARRSATQVSQERVVLQRRVSKAQAALDAAERAVRGEEARPTAFDPETMEWQQARVVRTPKGFDAKKAAALEVAARLRREDGAITKVWYDPKRSAWIVETAQPKPAAPEAPPPRAVPATLLPIDDAEALDRAMEALLAARTPSQFSDAGFDLAGLGSPHIADPAYMPNGELTPLRDLVERRAAAIEKDLEANPPADPSRDPRIIVQGKLEDIRGAFLRRDQASLTPEAPEAPVLDTAPVSSEPEPVVPEPARPDAVLVGRTGTVQDPSVENARPIEYELRIVESDTLLNSWDEGYPAEYQQRERRQGLIDKIAKAPDERMLLTETAGEGTPFVLSDGRTVFAGNHRTQGMRDATPEAYARLKAALVSRAAEFGFEPDDVALMRRPVMVRVLPEGIETPELSLAFNRAAGGLKSENIARTLNDALQPEDWALFHPGAGDLAQTINLEANKPFLNRVKALLSESERGKVTNEKGEVTLEGLSIIKATVIGKVLGDPASPIVVRLATLTDPGMAIYANGFTRALPDLLSATALMGQGKRPPVEIAAPLREALQLLTDPPTLNRLGTNLKARMVKEWESEGFDPAEIKRKVSDLEASVKSLSRSQAEDWFINGLDADPTSGSLAFAMWSMKSAKEVGDFLEGIAAAIKALPDPMAPSLDLFGGPPPVPDFVDIANAGIRRLNEARTADAGPMALGVDEVPLVRGGDGVARVVDKNGVDTGHRIHPVVKDPAPVMETILPTAADITLIGNDWRLHTETLGRTTGRVVISAGSDAEAAALRAYLAGDDAAILPRSYRVVDGQVEPLGDIRSEIVERIDGRYKAQSSKDLARGYLQWVFDGRSTKHGRHEGLYPANIRKFVDAELEYRSGPRPVPTDPNLPALRDALDGRDFEVRGPSDPVPVLDPDAPVTRPTEVVAGTPRDIDPDYEATTGLSPETTDADLSSTEAAAGGVHRVVSSSDAVHRRAAQRASGAPVVDDPRSVIEINAPDAQERLRLAQQAWDTAAANLEAARAKLDALGPAEDLPPPKEVLSGSELDLYHRYIDSSASPSYAGRQPGTVNEVLDLLTSLDLGVPPLRGAMAPEEMEALRNALLRVLNARLDDLGVTPPTGAARRGGVGARRSITKGVGTKVEAVPTMTTPEDLTADLSEVVRQLQGRVYEAADSLDGWEGTQYEIGLLPTTARDGGPLSPRIPGGIDWIEELEARFPTLGEELLHGRKQTWAAREEGARWKQAFENTPPAAFLRAIRGYAHTAFDARPERVIVKQSIDRFTEATLKHFVGSADEYEQAIGLVHGMIGKVHEGMKEAEYAGFPLYRRVGLFPQAKFEAWATKAFEGATPQWYTALKAEMGAKGVKYPLAELWRQNDNRIRAYFRQQPGGMAKLVDWAYDTAAGRKASTMGKGITVFYHVARFLMDLRWLGLEVIEAPTLTFFQEGPGAMIEGLNRGKNASKSPMLMGRDLEASMRSQYSWWLAQSDPGANIRTRERFLLAIVRRRQESEFPRALREAMARSEDLRLAVKAFDNGDEMAYLRRLDADWELASKRGQPLDDATAERLFRPLYERGVINEKELAEFLKAKRYTGHPAIDREMANLTEPWARPLMERLMVINEQGWNDAARLIFGQVDRSNVQRLMNHPLLYWPVSYQIKATKWLAGLLFDRAFGIDTGAAGAVTLGMIHQQHKDRMLNDPEYARAVSENPTLLFFAQMLFPIAPWDMGVGLSPFTRLAISAMTAEDETEGYRRNVFSVGPGYTYYSLLPRLFYEQSKPGSWGDNAGLVGDLFRAGQRFAPYSVPVAPKSTSELYNAEQQVAQGATYQPQPPLGSPFTPGG